MSERRPPTTSDVTRPRALALSALGAGLGVAIAVFAGGTEVARTRPIARPHAKVACASCHGDEAASPAAHLEGACQACHGAGHGSTRPGHRALAARGELTCARCHAQHAGGQGLTFADDAVVRWGAGAERALAIPSRSGAEPGAIAGGTTVPLVALSACAGCHDPARASNPIAACVPASARVLGDAGAFATTPSRCFDEHVRLGEPRLADARAACARQHAGARFVAWEAAREIATTTPWVSAEARGGVPWAPAGGALAGGALAAGLVALADRRRRRERAAAPKAAPLPPERRKLPVIDTSTCLGCYACVDACPFDVLAPIEKYVAVVARPDECCGVVLCEQVCPNGSLKIADGEPILDRPATSDDLESRDVPGLFIAGDLSGLPLIKNAINQGVRAVDRIHASLPRRRSAAALDVVVVGAGPAGLAAALRAKEKGLTCAVLEQATIAASIKSFPRDKIVHDPPLDLPVEGELWLEQATKEELVAQWTRIVRARALDVREGARVVDVARDGEGFLVRGEGGLELRAARVLLAIGRRGTSRALEGLVVEAGAEERVSYSLADARAFAGKRVVVVGLGDSAMEAAIALARQPGTAVTVVHRGARFTRGKSKNIAEIEALVARKEVRLLFETTPVAFGAGGVTLAGTGPHGGRRSVPADALLVLIGGVPAWDLLTRAGIRRPGT